MITALYFLESETPRPINTDTEHSSNLVLKKTELSVDTLPQFRKKIGVKIYWTNKLLLGRYKDS